MSRFAGSDVPLVDTAVILAAGRGTRLKRLGEEIPKGFLRLGEVSIIEESIERLVGAGVRRVVIVTGHLARLYEELRSRLAGLVETVHNVAFADSGSFYSLSLGAIPIGARHGRPTTQLRCR